MQTAPPDQFFIQNTCVVRLVTGRSTTLWSKRLLNEHPVRAHSEVPYCNVPRYSVKPVVCAHPYMCGVVHTGVLARV